MKSIMKRPPTFRTALAKTLPPAGFLLLTALFAGCGSSGGGSSTPAGPVTLGSKIDNLQDGEQFQLPMQQVGFSFEGEFPTLHEESAVFTMEIGRGPDSGITFVTIDSADGHSFTWNDEDDEFFLSDYRGAELLEMYAERTYLEGDTLGLVWAYFYDYVNFGYWEVADLEGSGADAELAALRGGLFWQGLETDPQRMPTSGSASYTGIVEGAGFHGEWGSYELEGDLVLRADFRNGAGTIAGGIENIGAWAVDPSPGYDENRVSFNEIALGEGSIAGNRFQGTAISGAPGESQLSLPEGVTGSFKGGFFGPTGEEVGGQFRLEADKNTTIGAFGGRRN